MRLKGINPIERHIEKFVLVVFGLVLLGLLVMQFLGSPNAIEVKGRTYAPGDAREPVQQLAQQKKGQIESLTPAPELAGDLPDYVTPFQAALAGQGGTDVEIASLGSPTIRRPETAGGTDLPGVQNDENLLHIASKPTPAGPIVAPFEGAVDPLVALPIADMVPQFGDQPYDLRGVSIQTSFDVGSFKSSLNNPPSNRNRLPLDWMRTIQILDVEYARQRMVDGEWVDDGVVPPMPGRRSLRGAIADPNVRPVDLQDILRAERDARADIRSPELYTMIAGLPWVAPADYAKVRRTLPDAALVTRLRNVIRSLDTDIERKTAQRADVNDPEGRGRGTAERLDREIQNAKTERENTVAQLAELGVDETGNPIEQAMSNVTMMAPDAGSMQNLLDESGELTLWAHDVTLEPGGTYRYRTRVVLTNPLFGRASRLKPEQKPLAETISVATDWSGWSDAINVPDAVQYFVLDANASRQADEGNAAAAQPSFARVLAAKFHYGYWRTAQARMDIGSVLSVEAVLPELWTWEIVEGEKGPELGDRITSSSNLRITAPTFLLGVASAVTVKKDDEQAMFEALATALDALVLIMEENAETPTIRTPRADGASPSLATIRFSAQKGDSATLNAKDEMAQGGP
ncbi:MAG: hypothetical protein RLN60_00805 [Phycisphaerales bacterium]